MSESPKMQKWFKVGVGTMVRCWCWTETKEARVDNGWRRKDEKYPHARVCDRTNNSDTWAYYLLYNAADNANMLDNDVVGRVLEKLAQNIFNNVLTPEILGV